MDDMERQRQLRRERDSLAFDTPNCPKCLHRMEPGEESWVCPECGEDIQV